MCASWHVAVLDAAPVAEDFDAVGALTAPFPVQVIAELLGVDDGDRDDFRRWSDAMIEAPDTKDPEVLAPAGELWRFLDEHLRDRVAHPRDDLTSMLMHAEFDGRPLTHGEARLFCLSLLVAGNETTRHLLSGSLLALWEHPDQRATLAADPTLVPGAVEECLRWVTPIQAFGRTATACRHDRRRTRATERVRDHAVRLGQPRRDRVRPDRRCVRRAPTGGPTAPVVRIR